MQTGSKHASEVKRLEAELDEALDSRDREARRADSDRREVARLQERILVLEAEQERGSQSVSGDALQIAFPVPVLQCCGRGIHIFSKFIKQQQPDVEAVREEMQGLLDSLRELSARNEEMMADKDADMVLIQTLNEQIKEYKRKYEQAKTELRNTRGQ